MPDTFIVSVMSLCIVFSLDLSIFDPSSLYQTDNEEGVSADLLQRIKYKKNKEESANIKLFNIGSIDNRKDIAIILEMIYEKNPRIIGIDIEFRGLKNKEEDLYLAQTVERIKDKAVFAFSVDQEDSIHHSFFCDHSVSDSCYIVQNVKEGLVSFDFDKTIRNYQMDRIIEGNKYSSFSASLLDMKTITDTLKHLIRYAPVLFSPITHDNLNSCDIEGCYVIVGELVDGKDIFNTPVGILHGSTIHAHVLNTILQGDIEENDFWREIWYTSIACLFFAFLLIGLDYFTKIIRNRHSIFSYWLNDSGITVLLLSIGFVVFLVSFAYYKFHNDNVYISLNEALVSVVIATGIIKSLWTGFVLWCKKKRKGANFLKYSVYYNIDF